MKTETFKKVNHQRDAAFFNAQQSADPLVCSLHSDTLSDGSVVWNVVFKEEVIFCLDRTHAETLIRTVNMAVREAQ